MIFIFSSRPYFVISPFKDIFCCCFDAEVMLPTLTNGPRRSCAFNFLTECRFYRRILLLDHPGFVIVEEGCVVCSGVAHVNILLPSSNS